MLTPFEALTTYYSSAYHPFFLFHKQRKNQPRQLQANMISQILLIIITIFLPPVGVFMIAGCGADLLVSECINWPLDDMTDIRLDQHMPHHPWILPRPYSRLLSRIRLLSQTGTGQPGLVRQQQSSRSIQRQRPDWWPWLWHHASSCYRRSSQLEGGCINGFIENNTRTSQRMSLW